MAIGGKVSIQSLHGCTRSSLEPIRHISLDQRLSRNNLRIAGPACFEHDGKLSRQKLQSLATGLGMSSRSRSGTGETDLILPSLAETSTLRRLCEIISRCCTRTTKSSECCRINSAVPVFKGAVRGSLLRIVTYRDGVQALIGQVRTLSTETTRA